SAVLAFERFFGCNLDIKINGQLELLAGNWRHLVELRKLFAVAVDDSSTITILSGQKIVVLLLDSGAAHDITLLVELICGTVEHVCRVCVSADCLVRVMLASVYRFRSARVSDEGIASASAGLPECTSVQWRLRGTNVCRRYR